MRMEHTRTLTGPPGDLTVGLLLTFLTGLDENERVTVRHYSPDRPREMATVSITVKDTRDMTPTITNPEEQHDDQPDQ